ncbi:MAG: DUF1080 domain-containing protein [Bryobacterales bacterium]|nr:DUF1080 domain-containing protein [Bryobacterales bacterium]
MRRAGWLAAASLLAVVCLPASAAEGKQLFNGRDLSGWKMTGWGSFAVEDGHMKTVGGMGLLFHEGGPLGDCTIRVVFKTTGTHGNSGVVIRMPEAPTDAWYGVHNGYEVQIDSSGDEWHATGALYSLSKTRKGFQKPAGEWNTMEITLDGQRTTVRLNGEVVNEFQGGQAVPERKMWYEPVRGPRPDKGYIGLQNHDPASVVYFREISVHPRTK